MTAIRLNNISKTYTHYAHGVDRLLEILTHRAHHQAFVALHPISMEIEPGQVVGIVGNNGAGKSTLLKLIAGTLQSDVGGSCEINGRISALLELGGGFHPEMTGRENVYLNGTMLGLSRAQMDKIFPEIMEFAGIDDFIDNPVKTYSSGMFVRLAFAVATCVEPDILIVDEALSVGDGAFARKSFNRIMQFKKAGKTILFCSHALYQVEAICDRVIWLENGAVKADGSPSQVISAYTDAIAASQSRTQAVDPNEPERKLLAGEGSAHITSVSVSVDGIIGKELEAYSKRSELCLTVGFVYDPKLATPTVGLLIVGSDGRVITSAGTQHDGLKIAHTAAGEAKVRVSFPELPLLKGEYWIDVYLLCEEAIHLYDKATTVASLKVRQEGLEQGVVSLVRHWEQI
jgi:lipopolysaccharide transport system ATP-binding protein